MKNNHINYRFKVNNGILNRFTSNRFAEFGRIKLSLQSK